jgi:hypothetical protein
LRKRYLDRDSPQWVKSRPMNRELCAISPLSTGPRPHFSLCATRIHCARSNCDRDGSPRLPREPATAGRCGRRQKDRSPPAGDGMKFEAELSFGTMTQRNEFRTSRQEAPEELVLAFAEGGFPPRETGHGKGTQPKKGRGTSRSRKPSGHAEGNWGARLFRELNRTTNRVFGPPRWKATPELVRQDRGRVFGPSGSWIKVTNTGRSFARRSGAWQQCRAPFLFGLEAPVGRHFPEVSPLGNGTPALPR